MLFAITRNTGFETDKGTLGACFTVDCCDWSERQELRVALDLTIRSLKRKNVRTSTISMDRTGPFLSTILQRKVQRSSLPYINCASNN